MLSRTAIRIDSGDFGRHSPACVFRYLSKPEYFFRPRQILKRVWRAFSSGDEYRQEILPWGIPLRFRNQDAIGRAIATSGVYDLALSEAIWRLCGPRDALIDVGANIGYITSIMTVRAGIEGEVFAFEPHPEIYADLQTNAARWSAPRLHLLNVAVGPRSDSAVLLEPSEFRENRGTATVAAPGASIEGSGRSWKVPMVRLDEFFNSAKEIALLKIDVEGNEFNVLEGCERLLSEGKIQNIIFEEHADFPTPASMFLDRHQFSLFRIRKRFFGPTLESPTSESLRRDWLAPNYLATLSPESAIRQFARFGWQCLQRN